MRRRVGAILAGIAAFAALAVLGTATAAGAIPGDGSPVFLNEIHYDNDGGDVGEFFEIAGPAGTDLSGWSVVLYNGSNGSAYNTIAFSGVTLADAGSGYGFYSVAFDPNGIQNGAPDGLALIGPGGAVAQFLSYEGTLTAVGGPADGMLSTDIGVSEPGSTPVGQSLQLTGSGTTAGDFTWTGPDAQSPDAANAGQTFLDDGSIGFNRLITGSANYVDGVAQAWDPAAPFVIPDGYEQTLVSGEDEATCRGLDIYASPLDDWHDMNTVNETGPDAGRYLYRTHEIRIREPNNPYPDGGAVSVIDLQTCDANVIAQDPTWTALDGIRWTPWGTIVFAEETTGGRFFEMTLDPNNLMSAASTVERSAVGLMAHEGIEIADDGSAVYVIDEFRGQDAGEGGGIYKFVPETSNDLSGGELFVLGAGGDTITGEGVGQGQWFGPIDPTDVRSSGTTAGGTSYQRPEDLEIIGNTLYAAITEGTKDAGGIENYEGRVLAIDLDTLVVTDYVKPGVNAPVEINGTATGLDGADNLATGPDGRLWIVEDNLPSDIWIANGDGPVAESLDLFASLTDPAAEASGIYFIPGDDTLYVNVQHSEADNGDGTWTIAVPDPVIPDLLIHQIQGPGDATPADGQLVAVEAIVTSLFTDDDELDGFFIQEEDVEADDDAATSEGVFVFCRFGDGCPAGIAVGDLASITGTVGEFNGMTQIDTGDGSITILSSGNDLPAATEITLGGGSTADAATFEATEGMIVTFPETLAVSEYFQLGRFGSIVLTSTERPSQFTDANVPSVDGYAAHLADLATRRIILDDDNNDQNDRTSAPDDNEPYAWPDGGLSTTNYFRGGDTINGLTGIAHWAFGAWRIRPIDGVANTFTAANPRPTEAPDVGGTMTVASFNVLNYFTTLDEPDAVCGPLDDGCRGANSAAELDRQRAKIVAAMVELDADVLGLMEIENDDGAAADDLVAALNAATAPGQYAAIDTGSIGTDAIKQAFIYQPATVTPVGDYAILDSSVDATFNDDKNRPALIQTFEQVANGARVTIAVNHLKSKGSDCNDLDDPDLNDGAANCNLTRTTAAAALANYLATDPTNSGDADVLIIGDLNAYAMETPVAALKDAGYTDLVDGYGGLEAYTYLFDGQLGSLDYAMSNAALTSQVTGTAVWHINADEVPLFDYNDEILDAAEASFERESSALPLYSADAFRSSDHDPVVVGLALDAPPNPNVTLSILHNNDGESKLLPSDDFPGIARFVTTLKDLQTSASSDGVITLTSGDNFLASKEFNASLDNGEPYYDSIALSGLYDAMALGNHDFDFGPDVTAAFISGFDPAIPFLSANADFSAEPALTALEASGQIAASTVIDVAGTQVGVIGAVTPLLPTISSPRNVVISADVAGAVNAEVAALEAAGVNKIILISHLQGVGEDRALIPLLSGVDIAIAGGGDELFANAGDTCNIGDVADAYPGIVTDADGVTVPLVTGPGGYRCIGQLDVTFNPDGELVDFFGAANLVPLDATPDATVLADVETPIAAAVSTLENTVLATTEVDLDGVRASVRTGSSNEGSLLADALLDAGARLADDFGAPTPVIGIQNGGGIRNDAVIPVGDVTEGDTFDIAPFANFVVVTEVPRDTFKALLEVAYGGLPSASGRFAQPAGFEVLVDPAAAAREIDSSCAVIGSAGERVLDVVLDDGTVIVADGAVVPGPDVALATIDFLARGGDCYPLGDLDFTALGVSYQQALADYIVDTLDGIITAADYPAGGTDRVVFFGPEPEFACSSDQGTLTWTDAEQSKYWIYRSVDNGDTYNWIGRTVGDTTFTDPLATAGVLYQVHYAGIPRVDCTIAVESPEVPPFECSSTGGAVSWTDAEEPKYRIYRSVDDGASYSWVGRTLDDTTFTDTDPVADALYRVDFEGIPAIDCDVVVQPFECSADNGVVTWTDAGQPLYWVYRSGDGGETYVWIGRTFGATMKADQQAAVGARYQVHYNGIPRVDCEIVSEPTDAVLLNCVVDGATLSWFDADRSKYWIYRSVDDGRNYNWIGRTLGETTFTDDDPVAGALYRVHYANIPRRDCVPVG